MTDSSQAREQQQSKAVELFNFALERFDVFRDQFGAPHVWVKYRYQDIGHPRQAVPVRSRTFRSLLLLMYFYEEREAISADALNVALSLLEAHAMENNQVDLSVRYATSNRAIYIDSGNDVIVIDAEGVHIREHGKPLFRRYPAQQKFELDLAGERKDIETFLALWNLTEEDKLLMVGWLGASMIPNVPHAILLCTGPQGSAKTSLTRACRMIIDPSAITSLSMPRDQNELALILAHNYCVPIDNVGRLTDEQVDSLCRAATGEAYVKRELYTDQEEVVFSIKHTIIINGVNPPSTRGDFNDRILLIEGSRVSLKDRREEKEIDEILQQLYPLVRGALVRAVSEAMRHLDSTRIELKTQGQGLSRMADFDVWGEAICRALAFEPFAFHQAYKHRLTETQKKALEMDELAQLLIRVVEGAPNSTWEGTPTQLLSAVKANNEVLHVVSEKLLPASPNALMRKLNALSTELLDTENIRMSWRKGKERMVVLERLPDSGKLEGFDEQETTEGDAGKSSSDDQGSSAGQQ